MKLLGRDIDAKELWEKVEARLQARGLLEAPSRPISLDGPEPFVDPLSFHLTALEAHADPTRPLPAEGSRVGALARGVLGLALRPVVRELFARQHLFNAHVRDAFAQLSAEVIALKQERGPNAKPPRAGAKPRSPEAIALKPQRAPTEKPPRSGAKPKSRSAPTNRPGSGKKRTR